MKVIKEYGLLDINTALSVARGLGEFKCSLLDPESGKVYKVLMQYKKGFVVITTLSPDNVVPKFTA